MWAQFDGEHVAGAARRRRERRHRAYLKYVRTSVAMALSEYKHHTSRGQNMDRAGGGVQDAVHGQVPEALLHQEPGTQHFTLDDDDSVLELGGSRPDRIATLSGPQERVLRRTVEQIVDAVPLVPLLDDPVPQTVKQQVDVLRFFNTLCPVSEQVDILCDVSVATHSWWNSWWKCRRPYPTLRYFSGLWSSTSTFQFLLVEGETLVFKVLSQNRVQPFRFLLQNAFLSGLWSRSLTFLLPVEAFTIFAQDRVHPQLRTLQLLGCALRMSHFKGFFALFRRKKKVRLTPGTSAHPRQLPMACAVGWMTTRVRLGRCSRIRRSAHGGTACVRTAPSGIRRGSAEQC